MDEILQEFVDSRGVAMRVDRQLSVLRGVKLLGVESRNGRRYLPTALAQAASLYEGAKVNVNHPKGHPAAARDYQDRLGAIRNVRLRDGEGLFGDLHFNPKHALAEQLLWDAINAPQNVGFSHNVEARTGRRDGQVVVEAIVKVQSVDLVADPATTQGLFESRRTETKSVLLVEATLAELRAGRPDLVEAIATEQTARLAELEGEVDRLRAVEATRERRATAARLLRQYHLPDPDLADAATRPIVSEVFLQSLLAAPSEQAMVEMIEERARAVAAARRGGTSRHDRPTSREQRGPDTERREPLDARAFARAIL